MSPTLVKLVAVLLLMVQGVIGMASGRVLCLRVQECVCQESGSGHGHEHGLGHGLGHGHGHQDGKVPLDSVIHENAECGCHVHVAMPDDELLPGKPRSESAEFKALCAPLMVEVAMHFECAPALVLSDRLRPPDFESAFRMCDQVRGLKSTRLLV